ncbi:MAG: hypothetical protein HY560_12600 [Gemmatimonadetes bacterium]|nr:hypothetical protein [Gemmatimonadota bacterium]
MTTYRSLAGRTLLAASLGVAAGGCSFGTDPGGPTPPTRITKMQAFLCSVRNAEVCQVRGDSIPTGTLPPTNEAFQVWVWHPGFNTTVWRLLSSLDSSQVRHVRPDSAGESFILNGAPAKKYTVRVLIEGTTGYLAEDSLHWEYP